MNIDEKIDKNEAPEGFYASPKVWNGESICRQCDARTLCVENKDEWCVKNRCMGDPVFSEKHGRIERKDRCSVVFKKIEQNEDISII